MHGAAPRLKDHHHASARYAAHQGDRKVQCVVAIEERDSKSRLMLGASSSSSLLCLGINTRFFTANKLISSSHSRAGHGRRSGAMLMLAQTPPPPSPPPHSSFLPQQPRFHSSSCVLASHGELGAATIWHALLPSSSTSSSSPYRLSAATAFSNGSWNVAGDARPARWLQGRHSAWLLFGFCSCFSAAVASSMRSIACCEAPSSLDQSLTHGKKVHKEFAVIGIPGDGRCLFRAVAHGLCTKQGKPTSDEETQRELADDLREKVVDELVKRRAESEWFIEGDFDEYTRRMRQANVWGGEPELLMLSHVLGLPITVYMADERSNGVIAIAEYGQEYGKGKGNPIRVLYHGFGHYDALLMPGDAGQGGE
ncbi:uncharacterized protein LOC9638108 [Selaginella moellendorffii]|nr:uncharacterized protein LOC9638108 [Selaginella moellendorffii]|eukprot:XP_002989680.2 uncharacterized protein LOC9638108 [Selaginella moellendorffii]